jgi:hypothetical protein
MFIDIDSLLRRVYGHAKHGASYGHTKIAGKQILRNGLSPMVARLSAAITKCSQGSSDVRDGRHGGR